MKNCSPGKNCISCGRREKHEEEREAKWSSCRLTTAPISHHPALLAREEVEESGMKD